MQPRFIELKVIRVTSDERYDVELAHSRTHQLVKYSEAILHRNALTYSLKNMGYRKIDEQDQPMGGSLQVWQIWSEP